MTSQPSFPRRDFLKLAGLSAASAAFLMSCTPISPSVTSNLGLAANSGAVIDTLSNSTEANMFFLIIARFRPNVYDELGMRGPQQERDFGFLRTDAQEKARKTAEQLFGAVYANVDPKFVTEEMREEAEIIEDPTTGRVTVKEKPSAGIEFTSLHAFQYSRSRPEKLGWMAIVDIANYAKLMQVLEWPTGELCQLYDMEIISLNETVANTDPTDIYTYMTPAQWGPTHGI